MKKRALPAVLVLVMAVMTSPAEAVHPGFGLGIHGGYGESKDADSGSPLAGVNAVFNITPWLGLVGMADYKFEEDFSEGEDLLTVTSIPLSFMGRLYLPLESFTPYVALGAQYRLLYFSGELIDNSVEFDDSDSAFGWLAGAGASFNMSATSEFFGEARYEATDVDEQDFEDAIENAEDLDYDQWSARAGITFFFN